MKTTRLEKQLDSIRPSKSGQPTSLLLDSHDHLAMRSLDHDSVELIVLTDESPNPFPQLAPFDAVCGVYLSCDLIRTLASPDSCSDSFHEALLGRKFGTLSEFCRQVGHVHIVGYQTSARNLLD